MVRAEPNVLEIKYTVIILAQIKLTIIIKFASLERLSRTKSQLIANKGRTLKLNTIMPTELNVKKGSMLVFETMGINKKPIFNRMKIVIAFFMNEYILIAPYE